jgi:membrane fusion protein, multidrug efflux system
MIPRPFARRPLQRSASTVMMATALITVIPLSGCGRTADAKAVPAVEASVPVRVVQLTAPTLRGAGTISVTGTLAGKEEVALAFKIGGVISRIMVDPGQPVRAGQVLAELRPTEIGAQVASAQESWRKAERDLARVTRLYADSVATLEQLQDARTGLELTDNALRIAQFNAAYAVIRAPGDGLVLSRAAEPGQVVEPGRAVLTVRRTARGLVIRLGLPDRDALRVRLGDSARVTFDALPGRQFPGRVTQRAAAATAGSGDYAAEVTLDNAAGALPTGLVARVLLHTRGDGSVAQPGRVLVPLDALVDADADSAAVFVLQPDRNSVSRRALKLTDVAEALRTAQVPVVSGLSGTETVVTVGTSRLLDGSRVRVITTPDQRSAADAPRATVVP